MEVLKDFFETYHNDRDKFYIFYNFLDEFR